MKTPMLVVGGAAALVAIAVAAVFAAQSLLSHNTEYVPEPRRYSGAMSLPNVAPDYADELSEPPQDYTPRISAKRAHEILKSETGKGGLPINQVVLAESDIDFGQDRGTFLWIFNFEPTAEQIHFECVARVIYSLAFIDAETGEVLGAPTKGAPVPGCYRYRLDTYTPGPNQTLDPPTGAPQ